MKTTGTIKSGSYYPGKCPICGENEYTIYHIDDKYITVICPKCGKYTVKA